MRLNFPSISDMNQPAIGTRWLIVARIGCVTHWYAAAIQSAVHLHCSVGLQKNKLLSMALIDCRKWLGLKFQCLRNYKHVNMFNGFNSSVASRNCRAKESSNAYCQHNKTWCGISSPYAHTYWARIETYESNGHHQAGLHGLEVAKPYCKRALKFRDTICRPSRIIIPRKLPIHFIAASV